MADTTVVFGAQEEIIKDLLAVRASRNTRVLGKLGGFGAPGETGMR